jgi:hypothetical protein
VDATRLREIARETGLDRKTVRRYTEAVGACGGTTQELTDDIVRDVAWLVQERPTPAPSAQRVALAEHRSLGTSSVVEASTSRFAAPSACARSFRLRSSTLAWSIHGAVEESQRIALRLLREALESGIFRGSPAGSASRQLDARGDDVARLAALALAQGSRLDRAQCDVHVEAIEQRSGHAPAVALDAVDAAKAEMA